MCGKFTYMATWAEVVGFAELLASRSSNVPEETAMPMLNNMGLIPGARVIPLEQ